jgi:hypothetical protein
VAIGSELRWQGNPRAPAPPTAQPKQKAMFGVPNIAFLVPLVSRFVTDCYGAALFIALDFAAEYAETCRPMRFKGFEFTFATVYNQSFVHS